MSNENNGSAVEDFLGKVDPKRSDSFTPKNDDPFAGKFPEGNKKEEKVGEPDEEGAADGVEPKEPEKELPFNRNPKVQRYIREEVERLTKHLTPSQAAKVEKEISESDDVVAAFTEIVGNDTPQKVAALSRLGQVLKGFEEKATSATRQIEAERKAEQEAEEELDRGILSVEDTFGVDLSSDTPGIQKIRKEYLDLVKRFSFKNEKGEIVAYPDFQEVFKVLQESKKKVPASNQRNRDLAARSMAPSSEAPAASTQKRMNWNEVDKHLSNLNS